MVDMMVRPIISVPAVMLGYISGNSVEIVLFTPTCSSRARGRLSPVLLNTWIITTLKVIVNRANTTGSLQCAFGQPPQSLKYSGMCQSAQIGPRIAAAPRPPKRCCRRGRAKSRQPGSSLRPVENSWMTSPGTSMAKARAEGARTSPPANGSADTTIRAGTTTSASAYQYQATRQRNSRPTQRRSPARPSATAVTMNALPSGPRSAPGRTPVNCALPRTSGKWMSHTPMPCGDRMYGTHASQLRPSARVKKDTSGCRAMRPRTPPRSRAAVPAVGRTSVVFVMHTTLGTSALGDDRLRDAPAGVPSKDASALGRSAAPGGHVAVTGSSHPGRAVVRRSMSRCSTSTPMRSASGANHFGRQVKL